MAYEEVLTSITLPASGDLSSDQYKLVYSSTAGQATVQVTRGGVVVGMLQDKSTAAGIGSKVGVYGVSKVDAGGSTEAAMSIGTQLVASTDGIAIAYSTAGSYVIGRTLEHLTSGTTAVISALITHEGYRST